MYTLLTLAAAISMVTASPGFVSMPFQKIPSDGNSTGHTNYAVQGSTKKKVTSNPDNLQNAYYQYITSFTLGNPPQEMKASLDTGSSDLWVYSSGASYNYDHTKSSSAEYVNDDFNIQYVDGTGASGDYYKDELTWGAASVTAQFAIDETYSDESPTGVFGVALIPSEATTGDHYRNYPYALKDAGLIESAAYSLYLNDADSEDGTILFGALDKSKYTGELGVVPLISDSSFTVHASIYGEQYPVILDAGTSLTYLPDGVLSTIARDLGCTYDSYAGAYKAGSDRSKSITYTFGDVDITIPPSELYHALLNNSDELYLTILPYTQAAYNILLGDSFLRSAYVVYDLDNKSIGIAQADYNPSNPDYEVITSDGIPTKK